MEKSKLSQHHRNVTKAVLYAQLLLEALDEIKFTQYYKQDVRNATNLLEKKLERFLDKPNEFMLNGEPEQVMMRLGRGLEKIMSLTLEDIYENDPVNEEQ